jgi:hypothetical protein
MRRAALFLLIAAAALPARAQAPAPGVDIIGALLDPTGHSDSRDSDEPDTAGQKPVRGPDPTLAGLPPPSAAPPPRPQLTAPVHIEETGKTPDAPPTPRDIAYDSRLRASFASAQSFQGPLEGGWMLTAQGVDLYALQLVDRRDRLEGVWRDVRRKGALDASGLVDDIQRVDSDVTLRFTPKPGAPDAVAVLHGGGDGRWSGELTEGTQRRPVVLRRSGP